MAELDQKIVIIDDNNVEREMTILFTFEDMKQRKFVAYYDPEDANGDIYASMYDDEHKLYPIEDDKDWEMVQEILESYIDENTQHMEDGDEHECCCHDHDEDHECGCDHEDGDDHECKCDHEHEDDDDHECCCKDKQHEEEDQ